MLAILERDDSVQSEGEAITSIEDMSRWAIPKFSKTQVSAAGAVLIDPQAYFTQDYFNALDVINNWRSAHGHPLNTFQTTLRIKGRHVDPNVLVAQRIKRLSSIAEKLRRFETMTLSQMQDIGGCRAIVSSVSEVQNLVQSYLKSDIKHKLHTNDNYLIRPKSTGYRGIHLIYRYYSDKIPSYNSLKIEMQFRSQVQHAWATAVEIVGTFTRQALKSSQGEDDWLRFFALMGTALATKEGTEPVPNTPTNRSELIRELNEASGRLDAVRRLQTYGSAPTVLNNPAVMGDHFFLLELDSSEKKLIVTGYKSSALTKATDDYLEAEKRASAKSASDAVLVSVDSLASLARAYPNYFLDTNLFVQLVQDALRGV